MPLPTLQGAIDRLKENEDRFDQFINQPTGYTNSEGDYVKSVEEFITELQAETVIQEAVAAKEAAEIYAESARVSELTAATSEENALAYANAALAAAKTYTTTAAGLAATTSGQVFLVTTSDPQVYDVYRNNAGVALLLGTLNIADGQKFKYTPPSMNGGNLTYTFKTFSGRVFGSLRTLTGWKFSGPFTVMGDFFSTLAVSAKSFVIDGVSILRTENALLRFKTASGRAPFGLRDNGTLLVNRVKSTIGEFSSIVSGGKTLDVPLTVKSITPTTTLFTYGDSLSTNTTNATGYPTQLATLYGSAREVKTTLGESGQKTNEIAVRQGGIRTLVTVQGNLIPASGSVNVTLSILPRRTDRTTALEYTGLLNGLRGTLRYNPAVGVTPGFYTFIRASSGIATYVRPDTPFVKDDELGQSYGVNVIWAGRNDIGQILVEGDKAIQKANIKAGIAAMVQYLRSLNKRFLILGVTTAEIEGSNSSGTNLFRYQAILEVNQENEALYPDVFIDIRAFLISKHDPANPLDVEDINNNRIPRRFYEDGLHFSTLAYGFIAEEVKRRIDALTY